MRILLNLRSQFQIITILEVEPNSSELVIQKNWHISNQIKIKSEVSLQNIQFIVIEKFDLTKPKKNVSIRNIILVIDWMNMDAFIVYYIAFTNKITTSGHNSIGVEGIKCLATVVFTNLIYLNLSSIKQEWAIRHQILKIETIKLTIVLVTKGPKPWLVGEFHHLSQLCLHDNEIGYQESRIQLREQICRTLKSLPQVKNFITQVANKDIYSNENGKPVSSSVDKKSYFKQHQMLLQLLRQIYQLSYSLHVLGQDKNCVNKINESQFLIKNIDQLRSQVGLPIYKMLISFMQKE